MSYYVPEWLYNQMLLVMGGGWILTILFLYWLLNRKIEDLKKQAVSIRRQLEQAKKEAEK